MHPETHNCYKEENSRVNVEGEGEAEDVLAGFMESKSHQPAQCDHYKTHS